MAQIFGTALTMAEPITEQDKREFVIFYREAVKLKEEFPDKLEVRVIFADLDGDGKEEALATSFGSFYEKGWDWTAFRKTESNWNWIRGYDEHSKAVQRSASVYARPGEIFRVTKTDGSFEFLILAENYDKLAPEGKGSLNKTRFYIDKDGVFQQEPVKDLERYLAYRVSGEQWPEGTLIKRLDALKVEIHKD